MNVCFNGQFVSYDQPLFTAQNRSFKWGDGLFETMKLFQGRLLMADLHFERMTTSMQMLQMAPQKFIDAQGLIQNILELARQNNCLGCARVRLAIYREENQATGYVIEAVPLDERLNQWPEHGQLIGIYPYARKAVDAFANIKSANFLPYVMAHRYAEENELDDAIVLNTYNNVCDSSRANIFLVKDSRVFTPALHQGCVNGVMRRVVIDTAKELGYTVLQDEVTEEQLLSADEVFLTNAIQVIRWVRQYKSIRYACSHTKSIFSRVSAMLFVEPSGPSL